VKDVEAMQVQSDSQILVVVFFTGFEAHFDLMTLHYCVIVGCFVDGHSGKKSKKPNVKECGL